MGTVLSGSPTTPAGPAAARRTLRALHAAEPAARGLLDLLLDAPTLRCKANHLTCVDGRDELAGPVPTQSVHVDLPNPLAEVPR